jgi:hypothetical protein
VQGRCLKAPHKWLLPPFFNGLLLLGLYPVDIVKSEKLMIALSSVSQFLHILL